MLEFEVKEWNKDGEFVRDARVGPHSLAMEIESLPLGSRLEVKRIARPEKGNVVPMKKDPHVVGGVAISDWLD